MQRIFHTPEGVRDIYNGECSQKHHLQAEIYKVFRSYGYEEIETPSIEYFEVFSKEVGTVPSRDLYKFFDREGNTLVLRPDFTPSVSRACATYFNPDQQVVTLCYTGNTFVNNSSYQGRLKETTQMGVERIGDDSPEADAELLAMKKACKKLGDWRLEDCTMYITLEPCQMGAGAIVQARVTRVVIGSMNAKAGCGGSILNLLEMQEFNHQAEVERGVLQEECSEMLSAFFRKLREIQKEKKKKRKLIQEENQTDN